MKPGKIEISNLNSNVASKFKSENLKPDEIVLNLLFTLAKVSQHYDFFKDELQELLQQLLDDPSIGSIEELKEGLMENV